MKRFLWFLTFCLLARAESDWRFWGGDPGGTRYSPLKQINRNNVQRLFKAWTYHTGDIQQGAASAVSQRGQPFEATPLVVDGVLYFSTPTSRVVALDPETGKEIWRYDPYGILPGPRKLWPSRGVAMWYGPKGEKRILYGTHDARLIELDARTGKPVPGFGSEGTVNLRKGFADQFPGSTYAVTSPPTIYKDLVITGAEVPESPGKGPSGAVRAFDVRSGKLVWTFHTVPLPGETGHETWEGDSWRDRTGANVWALMSVDVERGLLYLPIGAASYDFYGGDRKGNNLFANSVVCLDAATGKLRWHFQTIHHDLWDYDLPAQPVLITVRRDGREIPAVAQVTKSAFLWILDRVSGKPIFPVEERPVPPSEVPGEMASPTQPFPLKPPPLSRQSITRDQLSQVTPEHKKFCEDLFDSTVTHGMYTPWGNKLTLVLPGTLGGGTWSGGSFDPNRGLLFVNANETGAVGMMVPGDPNNPAAPRYRRTSKWGSYARFWDEQEWSCVAPPWGTLNAIDVSKGEIVWKVPLGVVDELEARGVHHVGTPSLGGSIATAGGLVFIGGTTDSRFRAFDSSDGKELWVAHLDASAHATPMTYMGKKTGKQFVVIAAGGGGYFAGPVSDALIAFTLP